MENQDPGVPAPSILIVEDDLLTAEDLAQTVEDFGYEVSGTVSTGEEAVSKTEETRPNLILMDISLRGEMDGIQAAEQILSRFDIPVVYLTAYTRGDLVERAKKTGPYGYLAKPFASSELRSTLETALYKHEADRRVRESEERLRIVVEQMPVLLEAFDDEGNIIAWNKESERATGYSREQVVKNPRSLEFMYPDGNFREYVKKTLEKNAGDFLNQEFTITCADGSERTIAWSNISTTVPIPGWSSWAIGTDVTERNRAEQALRDSEERYRQMAEHSLMGVFIQEYGPLSYVNTRLVEMLGYRPEEMIGKHVLEFVHPDDRELVYAKRVKRIRGQDVPTHYEFRALCKDGGVKWFEIYAARVQYQGRSVIMGNVMDITPRKKAEEALRESEDRYRQLTQNSMTGIYIHQDGVFVYANDRLVKMMGYPEEEIIGEEFWNFVHPEDRERIKKRGLAISEGKSLDPQVRFRVTRKNGETRWFEVLSATIMYQGRTANMGNVADITERKEAEESSLAQLQFLEHMDRIERSLADAEVLEKTMKSVLEAALSIFDCDRAWLMYPCDPEASVCRVPVERNRPEYPGAFELGRDIPVTAQLADSFREALTCKAPLVYHPEQGLPLPDSAVEFSIKSSMNSALFPQVGKSWLLGLSQCSHARVWTEEDQRLFQEVGHRISEALNILLLVQNLKESEERYRTLFEESTDAIFIVEPEGEIIAANPACERVFGLSPEDLVGSDVLELYWSPEVREKVRNKLETEGRIRDFDWRVRRRDGSERLCLLSSSAWKDPQGRSLAYFSIVRDVTDARSLERQLLRSQKMEAVGTLAGGIAHDVNNLLQVMLGQADMLLIRGGMDEKSIRSIEAIRNSVRHGADLVKRILAFSRETKTEMRPLHLNDELLKIQGLLRRTIPRMISIEMNLEDRLWMINADPSQLEQIILNLAVNATDAMPDGGRLVFETNNETLREEYCRLHPEVIPGKYVLLTVFDTGEGIEREILDRIFEPFFTTKQPGEGTGLGLSMVFGIVKSHGGNISCYSERGVGTTFKIYFPVAEMDLPNAVADTMEMPAGGTETLLLVDDEEAVRTLGSEMLELAGYTLLTAANGREALDVYAQHKNEISLVILDLVMPEMSGRQCLEELLRIDPSVKVLVASGYSANGPTKDALEGGAAGFISKPFDLKQILLAVRRCLDSDNQRD